MIDTQFGNLINGIHSKRKVIWMENCCGGDFQDEFTNDYCYFLSASGTYGASGAYPADDIFKMNNNSTYVSQLENEVIGQNTYTHGEWIFHMYSNANGASPDGDLFYVQSGNEYEIYGIGDYTNFDDNQDGFKTNKELFNYAFLTNSLQQIPQEADYGNIGD